MRLLSLFFILGLMITCPGCLSTQVTSKTRTVRVVSAPEGAWIWQKDDRNRHNLGRSPVEVRLAYKKMVTRLDPWSWVLPVVSGAVSAGGIWLVQGGELDDIGAREGGGMAMALVGGTVAVGSIVLNLVYYYYGSDTKEVAPPTTIGASLTGYEESWQEVTALKADDPLRFELQAKARQVDEEPGTVGKTARPIVAVFAVEATTVRLSPKERRILTDYLGVQLAAGGHFRVVPPEQVRTRLIQRKRESYRDCYDEACQIELGQALAADKVLSSKILRLDGECRVTAVLYDLRSEATDSAVSVKSPCDLSALTDATERVVQGLCTQKSGAEGR